MKKYALAVLMLNVSYFYAMETQKTKNRIEQKKQELKGIINKITIFIFGTASTKKILSRYHEENADLLRILKDDLFNKNTLR